jgi:hypothetical protein
MIMLIIKVTLNIVALDTIMSVKVKKQIQQGIEMQYYNTQHTRKNNPSLWDTLVHTWDHMQKHWNYEFTQQFVTTNNDHIGQNM